MRSTSRHEIYRKAKVGAAAGAIGGITVIISLFGIDYYLGAAPGTFYMMIGVAVGLHEMPAIVFGFVAHMLTAITIGTVFCVCSAFHRVLNLTSLRKGIFAGGVTGLEVYAIFFMPITLYLMMPTIDSTIVDTSQKLVTAYEQATASVLKANLVSIMWGALVIHVFYGSVMGVFSAMMLYEDYKNPTKKINKESGSTSTT